MTRRSRRVYAHMAASERATRRFARWAALEGGELAEGCEEDGSKDGGGGSSSKGGGGDGDGDAGDAEGAGLRVRGAEMRAALALHDMRRAEAAALGAGGAGGAADLAVPLEYRRALQLLREVAASGQWPKSSAARQMLIEGSAGGASGSFTLGTMPDGLKAPQANAALPALWAELRLLEARIAPGRPPSSTIAVNRNARFRPHKVAPPPPSSRTKWTRRVPHPVPIGHAASLTPSPCAVPAL